MIPDTLLLRDLLSALVMLSVIVFCLIYTLVVSAPPSPLERCAERFMTLEPDTRAQLVYGCAEGDLSRVHYLAGERWCRSVGPREALDLIEQVSHER